MARHHVIDLNPQQPDAAEAEAFLHRDLLRNVREFAQCAPCECRRDLICWRCLIRIRLQEYDALRGMQAERRDASIVNPVTPAP